MPEVESYRGKRVAVLGIGRSGSAAARLARKSGAEVTLLDDGAPEKTARAAEALRAEGFPVLTGGDALNGAAEFDLGVLSPGIDPSWPLARLLLDRGVRCVGELEFAWRHAKAPAIAITGTNGKTTTTGLVAHLLQACGARTLACGNYGIPLSEVLLDEGAAHDVYTLELSSFQLELTETFHASVAVWMNFAPDHLDRHPSLQAYRDAKLRVFANQTAADTAVVNGDETYPPLAARRVTFSAYRDDTAWTCADGFIHFENKPVVRLADTRLRGKHNAENIMAALAACQAWGLPLDRLTPAVNTFRPQRHRCELAGVVDGREFLNDSKATNIHALESALRGQERPVVLIAGGKDKGLDYQPARPLIREKTTRVFTIGEIRRSLAECWAEEVECSPCESLEEAVLAARDAAAPGQTVLFSPGTSSFDMFTGYDHRGNVFCEIVNRLTKP